jgi:hypothetical protein
MGEAAGAEKVVDLAQTRARLMHNRVDGLEASRVRAKVLALQGRREEATATLDEALSLACSMPYPYAEAKLSREYGMLHVCEKEPGRARERLRAALKIFRRLEAKKDAEQTRRAAGARSGAGAVRTRTHESSQPAARITRRCSTGSGIEPPRSSQQYLFAQHYRLDWLPGLDRVPSGEGGVWLSDDILAVLFVDVVQGYSIDRIAAAVLNKLLLIRSKPTEQTGLAESHRAEERDQRMPDQTALSFNSSSGYLVPRHSIPPLMIVADADLSMT